MPPNGLRYPSRSMGGTRQRRFDGANSKLCKLPENAATPTTLAPVLFRGSGALSRWTSGPLCWAVFGWQAPL